jgi:hypothetical protein
MSIFFAKRIIVKINTPKFYQFIFFKAILIENEKKQSKISKKRFRNDSIIKKLL